MLVFRRVVCSNIKNGCSLACIFKNNSLRIIIQLEGAFITLPCLQGEPEVKLEANSLQRRYADYQD
jgi:hypothetical protein